MLDQTSDMSDSYLLSDEFCDFQDHLLDGFQFQQNAINSTYTPPCVSSKIESLAHYLPLQFHLQQDKQQFPLPFRLHQN